MIIASTLISALVLFMGLSATGFNKYKNSNSANMNYTGNKTIEQTKKDYEKTKQDYKNFQKSYTQIKSYYPKKHWTQLSKNSDLEALNQSEIRATNKRLEALLAMKSEPHGTKKKTKRKTKRKKTKIKKTKRSKRSKRSKR